MKIEIISQRSGIYGGIKRLYQLASYFIEEDHEVVINFDDRSTNNWFKHSIPENLYINPDIRIMPETWQKPHPSAKNILYVQAQFDPPKDQFNGIVTTTKFLKKTIEKEGFIVNQVIPYGFNSVFHPNPGKRISGRIAYMPRKNGAEASLIRSLAPHFDYFEIDGMDEAEVINALQSSDIFLAISRIEGFGMPFVEAALCGCLVIGYHGMGGKEWLTNNTCCLCEFPQEIVSHLTPAINGAFENKRSALYELIKKDLTVEKEKMAWLNIINAINKNR